MKCQPVRRVSTFSDGGTACDAGGGESKESLFRDGSSTGCCMAWEGLFEENTARNLSTNLGTSTVTKALLIEFLWKILPKLEYPHVNNQL